MFATIAEKRQKTKNPGIARMKRNKPIIGEMSRLFKEKPFVMREKAVHKR